MQQIVIKGFSGMTHMLYCTTSALIFSDTLDFLNVQNVLYHEWRGWECFNNIYKINHKNYNNESLPFTDTSNFYNLKNIDMSNICIPPNVILHVDATSHTNITPGLRITAEMFFKYFSLTEKYQRCLNEKISALNNGKYIALQFRGSDVCRNKQISREDFLSFCDQKINEKKKANPNVVILLASDNQDVLIKHVDNKHIFTNSIAYELYKKDILLDFHQTLHTPNKSFANELFTCEQICANAALDLFLLAYSKKLFADTKSGFGQWAVMLNKFINK
jgi:hypothetical protein